jgi:hypothetical protein
MPGRPEVITGNHVALVDRGRTSSQSTIQDGFAVCDTLASCILVSGTKGELGAEDCVAAALFLGGAR